MKTHVAAAGIDQTHVGSGLDQIKGNAFETKILKH